MNVAVIVQARMKSTRLPGKVLRPIVGKTMLERQIERILAASEQFELVVATTPDPADLAIFDTCRRAGVRCIAGHPTNLLDRHVAAARSLHADVVVKIPSDCPLIDPDIIDRVIGCYRAHGGRVDFVSNLHPATYPDGNDVEVMSLAALETALREATRPLEREHTTPFIWEHPEMFRLDNVPWETGLDYSMSHRFTVDYEEDYEFVRAVYERLWSQTKPIFRLSQILALLAREPSIFAINAKYRGVNWYRNHLDELVHVSRAQTRSPGEAP
jgi:spore coat polysaccharide biosynthesis protein SpsF